MLTENNNSLKVNMVCNPYKSGQWELVEAYAMDSQEAIGKLDYVSSSEHSAPSMRSSSTTAASSLRSGSQARAIAPQPRGKSIAKKPVVMVPPRAPRPPKANTMQKAGAQIMNVSKVNTKG